MIQSAARSQIIDGKKQCGKCREWLPVESFNVNRHAATGLASPCNPCDALRKKESLAKNPPTYEQRKQYKATYHAKHPDRVKRGYANRNLAKRGATLEWFERQLEAQGGVCMICRLPETAVHNTTRQPKNLAVDHCHDSGIPRGLLCSRCNTALGLMADDPSRLREAAFYLEKARAA